MKLSKLFFSFLAALAMSTAANAAILTSSTGSSANVVTDYSTPSLVSFDLDLEDFSSTTLNFMIEQDDLLGPLSLNAIIRNLSGVGLERFTFTLDGIPFFAAGSVTPTFGTIGQTTFDSDSASIAFSTPEWAEFHFGNPTGVAGDSNWVLSTAGLAAGDSFSITATVPEPSSLSLMLAAMALIGAVAVRRRDQR